MCDNWYHVEIEKFANGREHFILQVRRAGSYFGFIIESLVAGVCTLMVFVGILLNK